MTTKEGDSNYFELARYRRQVTQSYAKLRSSSNAIDGVHEFRQTRDALFSHSPVTPLSIWQRAHFSGLTYAPYNPDWRYSIKLDTSISHDILEGDLPEGPVRYQRYGRANFTAPDGSDGHVDVFWIMGYGGGLFLPFRDASSGQSTYGGGRYLIDTIKGADLGSHGEKIIIDFNMAYHPSCYYSTDWTCPLLTSENNLPFTVPVGEQKTPSLEADPV